MDQVKAALASFNLKAALAAARASASANPSDAAAQQVQGILEVANGNIQEAEGAFSAAIAQGDALDPSETGLEKYNYAGMPLHEALRTRQKVRRSRLEPEGPRPTTTGLPFPDYPWEASRGRHVRPRPGRCSANRIGACRAANAAVAWLENNSPRTAEKYAQQALDFHEDTAKVYASMGEVYIRQTKWKEADYYLKKAEDRDQAYPYELYLRAQYYHAQQDTKDEERALFQAMACSTPRFADEDRSTKRNKYDAGSGESQASDHEYMPSTSAFAGPVARLQLDDSAGNRGLVDDLGGSYQRRDYFQGMFGESGSSESLRALHQLP